LRSIYVQATSVLLMRPKFSAVFQAGGLVVVLVEVMRKAYLASIVPVIVNAILNEHQLVIDIVAFVSKGDFPRSRLGEKQRGKILASWVTRKMRTIAQFGIRDPDGADSQITEVAEPRSGIGSVRNGSLMGGQSISRTVESPPATTERQLRPMPQDEKPYAQLPTGISEMPADYANSIQESPPIPTDDGDAYQDDGTPTDERSTHFELADHHAMSPADTPTQYYDHSTLEPQPYNQPVASEPYVHNKNSNHYSPPSYSRYDDTPILALPSVTGHDSLMPEPALWNLPSSQQQQPPPRHAVNATGGLRVANASSDDEHEEEWPQEAIMHMNLASGGRRLSGSREEGRYDGSGYGGAI